MKKRRNRRSGEREPNGRLKRRRTDLGVPLPERQQHGTVHRLAESIADDDGRPVFPYRAVSLLAGLEHAAIIDNDQRVAGDTFRDKFFAAGFIPLHAAPLLRSPVATGGHAPNSRVEAAQLAIYRALGAVGGFDSPAGSVLWNVIGYETSLSDWSLAHSNGRRITSGEAQIILVFALGELAKHYRIMRPGR